MVASVACLAALALVAQEPGQGDRTLEARVGIDRTARGATVEAAYTLRIASPRPSFQALAVPGQRLSMDRMDGDGLELARERRPGLHRVTLTPAAPGRATLRLRYRVDGRPDRIPVFSPSAPIVPGATRIRIRVEGDLEGIGADPFPRFERGPAGGLVAAPTNMPSVVLLPTDDGSPTVGDLSSATVLLLMAGGTVYWALWARRRRRSGL